MDHAQDRGTARRRVTLSVALYWNNPTSSITLFNYSNSGAAYQWPWPQQCFIYSLNHRTSCDLFFATPPADSIGLRSVCAHPTSPCPWKPCELSTAQSFRVVSRRHRCLTDRQPRQSSFPRRTLAGQGDRVPHDRDLQRMGATDGVLIQLVKHDNTVDRVLVMDESHLNAIFLENRWP